MQLAEDPAHVDAHVGAHGRLADHTLVGELLIAQPLGNQEQHLQLARGERLGSGLQIDGARDFLQQLAGDGRMERWLAATHLVDGPHELWASVQTMSNTCSKTIF